MTYESHKATGRYIECQILENADRRSGWVSERNVFEADVAFDFSLTCVLSSRGGGRTERLNTGLIVEPLEDRLTCSFGFGCVGYV